jgi:hypothetical protein
VVVGANADKGVCVVRNEMGLKEGEGKSMLRYAILCYYLLV